MLTVRGRAAHRRVHATPTGADDAVVGEDGPHGRPGRTRAGDARLNPDTYTLATIQRIVELVNLFVSRTSDTDESATPDTADTRDELCRVLTRYGVDESAVDVSDFAALAAALHPVFTAHDRDERAARLNELLEQFRPVPYLVTHDGEPLHFHYVPRYGPPTEHVGASSAMALANALVEEHDDRLGVCAAPGCQRVFFDRSRNRTQRYCRKSCATRVHVAAHRARR